MVQSWTPSEIKATAAAAIAKIGVPSAAGAPAEGVETTLEAADASDFSAATWVALGFTATGTEAAAGADFRFTVACGTALGTAGRVILDVSIFGSPGETTAGATGDAEAGLATAGIEAVTVRGLEATPAGATAFGAGGTATVAAPRGLGIAGAAGGLGSGAGGITGEGLGIAGTAGFDPMGGAGIETA